MNGGGVGGGGAGRRPRPRRRNAAALAVGLAMVLVLIFQWRLAIVHTRVVRPHDLFLSSFAASPRSAGGVRPPGAGEDAPPSSRDRVRRLEKEPSRDDGTPPYILSDVCGGCLRSLFDTRSCYTIMQREVKKSGGRMSLLDAAAKLGNESEACKLCSPARCMGHYLGNGTEGRGGGGGGGTRRSKYWRFDRVHPAFANPTTLTLTSIPDKLRIPPSRFGDIGAYFREKHELALANNTSMDYLVEYNPSIVAIPANMRGELPGEAAYLLSLRVTPANNCFSERVYEKLPKGVWNAVYHTATNHLGLALLDDEYRTIPGYDAILEIDTQLDVKRDTNTKAGDSVSPTFMDYRLFVLNDAIYLHVNADTVLVTRLSLRAKGFGDDAAYLRDVDPCAKVAEANPLLNWETPCRLDNLYGGDGLQVSLMRQFNTIWSGGIYGKNYALFGVPNATHPDQPDATYAEVHIFPRHRVQRILPDEHVQLDKQGVFDRIWKPGTHKRRRFRIDLVNMRMVREVGNMTESGGAPPPSFPTVDAHEAWFPGTEEAPFKESAHGGACCVPFSEDDLARGGAGRARRSGPLLVGIGHTKVVWKPWYSRKNVPQERKDRVPHTHYVSLFYAFESEPPFRVVARSGYFCLGHVPPGDDGDAFPPSEGGAFNPRHVLTRNRGLRQNNVTFDCPQMSFVSSFAEKAGDPGGTVIGYGLNDCTGRLVEVEKREIVRLLYPDPMDMIFD